MSYTQLPTRTSSDSNASADVNQLQDNFDALLDGSKNFNTLSATTVEVQRNIVLTENAGSATAGIYATAGSLYYNGNIVGTKPDFIIQKQAGSFLYPTTAYAPLSMDTGTNGVIFRQLFDDTTEEFVLFDVKVPNDLNTSGRVVIEAIGYAVTATAGKNIEFTLSHSAKNGESWDAAYATLSSGDLSISGTQDVLDYNTYGDSVSNLGWAANDNIRCKLSRTAPSTANLSGDYGLVLLNIRIPRT